MGLQYSDKYLNTINDWALICMLASGYDNVLFDVPAKGNQLYHIHYYADQSVVYSAPDFKKLNKDTFVMTIGEDSFKKMDDINLANKQALECVLTGLKKSGDALCVVFDECVQIYITTDDDAEELADTIKNYKSITDFCFMGEE